ncbi:MAG: copper homeostasis protein CutC [Phycisphaerae bacterium]|nr:copper homeostasis protein CutC [Phycisphaerae bacterium]
MLNGIFLEVCCGSVDDAIEASSGGADRVELNSSMFFGGLTPSMGSVIEAKKQLDIPVIVMIRPRGGGFCYTAVEYEIMLHDTKLALDNGADGIVFGILKPDGTIDVHRSMEIVKLAKAAGKDIVFHRAFDVTPNPFVALEQLIDMGIDRILTSGQEDSVPQGIPLLKQLIEKAGERIEILPGGGIKQHNAAFVIKQTGTKMIHIAAFKTMIDNSCQNRPAVTFGGCLYPPENQFDLINRDIIKAVSDICKG